MKTHIALSMRKFSYAIALTAGLLCSTARADTILDLTTAGATRTGAAIIGGSFIVQQIDPQSTGTGVIDPFLRIQANGNEQGYNTSGAVEYDAKAGTWTHALQLSSIPIVNIGGSLYRQFLLDINQSTGSTNNLLSLNQIQLFQSAADVGNTNDTLTAATATAPPLISFAGASERFRMNNASDPNTEILLNYDLNPGSGAGDMFLYVLNSAFNASPFVTMYAQFGTPPGGSGSNDGFEEWAVLLPTTPPQEVPEPTSVVLFGTALIGVCHLLRKRFAAR